MDKKKVEEHIQRALVWIDPMTTESANYEMAIKMAAKNLEFAIKELSKSDWVSVEDGLPEYNEMVLVCNKESPSFVKESFRMKSTDVPRSKRKNLDSNEFISFTPNHGITHWKPIEKLEE